MNELAIGDGSEILIYYKGLWGRQYYETLCLEGIKIRIFDSSAQWRTSSAKEVSLG